jgi:hypothetical protein
VTLDKTFYSLFKQEVVAVPVTSKFSSLLRSWTRPYPPPSSAEVKERVELYLYSPMGLRGLFQDEFYIINYTVIIIICISNNNVYGSLQDLVLHLKIPLGS